MLGTSFLPLGLSGFGLFLPLIRGDLGLSYTEAGSLAAAATIVYAAMQVPSGMLADRWSPRRLFVFGTLATNLLVVLFATSASYAIAVGIQAISGVTRALAFAPGLVLMSTWFEPRRRATAMGLFMASGFLWTVAFAVLGPAAAAATDWRTVLAAFGAMGIAIAIVSGLTGSAGRSIPAASGTTVLGLRHLIRRPAMWLVGYIQFTRLAVVQGVALWLPTFLVDERGLSLALAGGVVAATALAAAPSNLIGGYVADRTHQPYLVIGVALVALGVALASLAIGQGLLVLGLAIAVIACFQQLYFGPLFAAPITLFGQGTAGLVSGAGNLFANLGAFAAGLGLGVVTDATGSLAPGFVALATLCGLAVVATWRLRRFATAILPSSAPAPDPL